MGNLATCLVLIFCRWVRVGAGGGAHTGSDDIGKYAGSAASGAEGVIKVMLMRLVALVLQ
eukprot:6206921-Pleurochrysis_carterae.AAC.2